VSTSKGKTDNAPEQVREWERLNRLKAEFLSDVSQELRAPIHAILGYTELLLDSVYGPVTDEQEEAVDFIRETARDLLGLVNNLLDLSRIESGRADLIIQSFDVRELVNEVTRHLQPVADSKHIALNPLVLTDECVVRSDRGKLKQILLNLVGNAIKFTEHGKVNIAVATDTKSKTGGNGAATRLSISVQDSGIGIPGGKLDRIFEKFPQAVRSASRLHEGTGLGLYITKQLLDLLGGRVDIQSTPARGTTVIISLSRSFDEIEGIQRLRSRIAGASPAGSSTDSDGTPRSRAQRTARYCAQLKAGLGSGEYKVRVARDCEEAVSLAVQLHPLVVLLDAQGSAADPWSVFQELKDKPETRNIPIICLSNDVTSGARRPPAVATASGPRKTVRRVRGAARIGSKNVLIVEDEDSFRDVLKCVLDGEGYRLHEAATGREAIAKLESKKPDLVLLDLKLPDTDGWGVMQYMIQHPKFKDVEVLIISGLMLDERESAEVQTREYGYIYKGEFKVDHVLERVADMLEVT
jgi:CheY-like chemotaxis protein/two-component sensor histidine kinase